MDKYKGPDGCEYDLTHLKSFSQRVSVKVSKIPYSVPVKVIFRDHCYTRTFCDDDDPKWLIGSNRIFCPDRWVFSQGLSKAIPTLMEHGICFRTTAHGQYFKFERSSHRNPAPDHGWYLFFKFRPNREDLGVLMSVESVHERRTWPHNARGRQSLRFGAALSEFLKRKPEVLDGIQKEKAPK